MKKIACLLSVVMLGIASLAFAESAPQPELRPIQKVMQARAAWVKAMNENLGARKMVDVARDAGDLSAQAAKVAGGVEGERKELNQKISDLAKAISVSATKGEEDVVKAKLGEIKATCAECHAKFRDKK